MNMPIRSHTVCLCTYRIYIHGHGILSAYCLSNINIYVLYVDLNGICYFTSTMLVRGYIILYIIAIILRNVFDFKVVFLNDFIYGYCYDNFLRNNVSSKFELPQIIFL